jgi:hypothetical protein
MNLITAENRELALSISINQRNPRPDHKTTRPRGICYMALTFGTLLSSQGADAQRTRPSRAVVSGLCCPARRPVPASRSSPAQRESYVAGSRVSNPGVVTPATWPQRRRHTTFTRHEDPRQPPRRRDRTGVRGAQRAGQCTPTTVRRPLRSTSQPPGSQSSAAGTASASTTRTLFT